MNSNFRANFAPFFGQSEAGGPSDPCWADRRHDFDWLFKITGLSLGPGGFSQNDPLIFWAFNEKVLTPSSVRSWNWPELLIRRHFLAEKRGLLI